MEEYVIINIKSVSFAIPCVCSPVEAGEGKTIAVISRGLIFHARIYG